MKPDQLRRLVVVPLLVFASVFARPIAASPKCTELGYNDFPHAKRSKLYLYFPAADDSAFPDFGIVGVFSTTPARKFDVAELMSYSGTGLELRDAIVDVVTDTFCEFNVEVIATASAPPSTFPRRNVVAIGTDRMSDEDNAEQWGQAQGPDANDQTAVDFARVWAGTYQAGAGQPFGALHGVKSTTERWARSIGGTVAHEAGHNYGLMHSDGYAVGINEDPLTHHLMADGKMFDDEARASYRRHLSDNEYAILASNVGLSVQTALSWTLVNPNQETATSLALDFLTLQPNLTLAAVYSGSLSPWSSPSLSRPPPATAVFQGVTYFHYRLTWSVAKPWDGGAPGEVTGGTSFHVGASFNAVDPHTPDPIIITSSALSNGSRGSLDLRPRIPSLDAGIVNPANGDFEVPIFNTDPIVFQVESATVQFLPRLASMDSMRAGAERLYDPFGLSMTAWARKRVPLASFARVTKDKPLRLRLANLRDGRRIVRILDDAACRRGDTNGKRLDTTGCKPGINVSLFPATSTLLTTTTIDPKARQWDRRAEAYVVAPLRTTVYYQFAGIRPDLNRNGIDDYIDIVTGRARDRNGDWLVDSLSKRR